MLSGTIAAMTEGMPDAESREARAERAAEERGLVLQKSRRRGRWGFDYGRYWLYDRPQGTVIVGGHEGVTLDEIETYLYSGLR